jgi:hypothetical protein
MQAIRAIYDGTKFTPQQPVPKVGHCEVVITFLTPGEVAFVKPEKRPRTDLLGLAKGKVRMADDFDAPLEEMEEYM